jgi:3-oxoacyl-[acyl-carrier protein] reductase
VWISRTYNGEFSEYKGFHWLKYDLSDSQNIESFLKENLGNQLAFDGYVNNAAFAYDDIITNMNINKFQELVQAPVLRRINEGGVLEI